jgi:uncharacterized protein YunC (DUF1805 family)
MLKLKKIKIGKKYVQALSMNLSSKSLVVLRGEKGYVMCGYLNLAVANRFKDVAIKITGPAAIEEALKAKVHSLSFAALRMGIYKGQPIKEVLKAIA